MCITPVTPLPVFMSSGRLMRQWRRPVVYQYAGRLSSTSRRRVDTTVEGAFICASNSFLPEDRLIPPLFTTRSEHLTRLTDLLFHFALLIFVPYLFRRFHPCSPRHTIFYRVLDMAALSLSKATIISVGLACILYGLYCSYILADCSHP